MAKRRRARQPWRAGAAVRRAGQGRQPAQSDCRGTAGQWPAVAPLRRPRDLMGKTTRGSSARGLVPSGATLPPVALQEDISGAVSLPARPEWRAMYLKAAQRAQASDGGPPPGACGRLLSDWACSTTLARRVSSRVSPKVGSDLCKIAEPSRPSLPLTTNYMVASQRMVQVHSPERADMRGAQPATPVSSRLRPSSRCPDKHYSCMRSGRHPARAGTAVGAVAADPAAAAAGCAAGAGHAGVAGGAAHGDATVAGSRWPEGRGGPRRPRHADPALRLGGEPQHSPSLPGCTAAAATAFRALSRWLRPPTTNCARCCRP